MSDDYPYAIPEMDPTLRKQIQECNWQVVNVTTPANYFHVLRRQVSAATVVCIFITNFKLCTACHFFVAFVYRFTGSSVNLLLWWLQRTCFVTRSASQIYQSLMMSKAIQVLTNKELVLNGSLKTKVTMQILRRVSDVWYFALERYLDDVVMWLRMTSMTKVANFQCFVDSNFNLCYFAGVLWTWRREEENQWQGHHNMSSGTTLSIPMRSHTAWTEALSK